MIWILGLAFVLSLLALRRATPLSLAFFVGCAIWRVSESISAMITGAAAAYATTAWLLDAAASRPLLRRASVAIEIGAAGVLAGVVAAQIAGRHDLLAWWIAAASAATAMAIVTRWRQLAF